MSVFIPPAALARLKEYRYQSEDRSVLTKYVLKPFWSKFVRVFPMWMAPNMVTLLGLLFIVVSDVLVFWYDADYLSNVPWWVYLYHGFAVFMYQTFDACDGMHARRTGQSSPLGELFDHCCDSMNTTLMSIVFCSVAGTGKTWMVFLTQFASLANFYMSTWEEYYTHKLFLAEISGPVEGLIMIAGVFVLTGLLGKELVWDVELFEWNNVVFTSTYVSTLAGVVVMGFCIISARSNVVRVLREEKRENELAGAQLGLVPFFAYYASVFALLYLHPDLVSVYTTPVVITIGSCVSFCVGRIITGHLTKQQFPYWNLPTLIPCLQLGALAFMDKLGTWDYESALACVVWCGMGASVTYYAVFITIILYDITTFLDIYALSIKHPQKLKE